MNKHYLGYTPIGQLPIGTGDVVVIPRGTLVRTSHPSRPDKPAGRSYKVVVNHTLCGCEVQVGHVYPDGSFHEGCWHGDLDAIKQEYGTEDICSLWPMMKVVGNAVFIPTQNPKVAWVGEGGYWCEAEINDVRKIHE